MFLIISLIVIIASPFGVRMESNRCPQKDDLTHCFLPDEYPRRRHYRACLAVEFRPSLLLVVRPRRRMCCVRRRDGLAGRRGKKFLRLSIVHAYCMHYYGGYDKPENYQCSDP